MTGILDNALEYLKTYYPTDFEKWTALDEYGPPGFGIHHAIGVVNLARLVDDIGLLLMALLVCCEFEDGEQLIHGFEREDGSREQLTLDDVGRCYSAQIRLAGESAKIALRACRPELSDACKTRQDCADTFEGMLNKLGDIEDPRSISHFDPSAATQAFLDIFEDDDLCARCQAVLHARVLRERKASWAKLPEIFNLTSAKGAIRCSGRESEMEAPKRWKRPPPAPRDGKTFQDALAIRRIRRGIAFSNRSILFSVGLCSAGA